MDEASFTSGLLLFNAEPPRYTLPTPALALKEPNAPIFTHRSFPGWAIQLLLAPARRVPEGWFSKAWTYP